MVMDWIASNYRSEKEAAIPRPLDPPADRAWTTCRPRCW